jgi:hypothetical protein
MDKQTVVLSDYRILFSIKAIKHLAFSCQAMKRHKGKGNACYQMKKANIKELHIVGSHLCDILEKV